MRTRTLGETGLNLTELSFGAGAIGNLYRPVDRDSAMAAMQAAWDARIRYFDTAPFYGHGLSERRVGDFLRDKDGWVLSSKVGKLLRPVVEADIPDHGFVDPLPFTVDFDYTYNGIMKSYEMSLARLGLNRIDILYVHDLEPRGFDEATYKKHLTDFFGGGHLALTELKSSGAIKAFGLGVNEVQACLNILVQADLDVILLAGRFSLLDRRGAKVLLPLCEQRGVSIVAGGVFNSGILATGPIDGAYFDYAPAPRDICEKVAHIQKHLEAKGHQLPQAALQFPLTSPVIKSVLIGSAKAGSVKANAELMNTSIDPDDFEAVNPYTIG
ncbi:aldo/keto reductase [Labrenzia sp. PHM005]|uniref:aldo/keto reductase n=1 Tax=Labrenzia sp. PHM005 TaxID=2590016 RepID=UPI0011408D62|nr:aldo/keto reductase [Labrenzia sp. PHM005]QDG76198.1 aldo/keto reductase [Labrenzia sp. PHM005]